MAPRLILPLACLLCTMAWPAGAAPQEASPAAPGLAEAGDRETVDAADGIPDIGLFYTAASLNPAVAEEALGRIAGGWRDGYASVLVDLVDLLRRTSLVDPRSWIRLSRLTQFLQDQTGQELGNDVLAWRTWLWSQPYDPHPGYADFKGQLYAQLDPRFADFFQTPLKTAIRLDQIDWGGVGVNGIPPLDHPATVSAAEADYLEDDHVVFGVFLDGGARAYPKRILAWHEMALDRVGDREVTLVYCTLCGTVIPYDSTVGGMARRFGTSGLLYQSNKLMFDEGTHSLWSSLEGVPVVGPLVGSGLRLSYAPVVTTTWGEWRRRHPETTVLSLDTGFERDYSEGTAYRQYFSTDRLMFPVSRVDGRLRNKDEVLVLRPESSAAAAPDGGAAPTPVVIAADYLRDHPVYHTQVGGRRLVVVTSRTGANRVYDAGAREFRVGPDEERILDAEGGEWIVDEDRLLGPDDTHPRVPAHRAFWFAWYAQHPETALVQ